MPRSLTRRDLLRRSGLALGAAPLLAACARLADEDAGTTAAAPAPTSPATEGAFAGRSLTILVYSGLTEDLYRRAFVPQFEARTGARVTIDAAWTEGIARLDAAPGGRPPFDLVLTDPTQGLPAAEQGLFQQFDTGLVPNAAANFHPNLLDTTIYAEGFGIPFHSSSHTLGVNTDLVPGGIASWGELLTATPEQGVMLYNLPYMSLYTFAEMMAEVEGAGPGEGAALLEADLDGVLDFAAANRDVVRYFWPSTADGVNALVGGEVAAGNIHGNGLLAPIRDGAPVEGVIPPGTDAYVQLFFSVPTGVPDLELSLAALDHICSREFQQALAESGEYACAVPDIAEAHGATDPLWAAAFPATAQAFDDLRYYPYDVIVGQADRIQSRWDAEVLR